MGFLGFRRPKWKHGDADVRLRAVQDLAADHQGVFRDLAQQDPDPRVRASAAGRVTDSDALQVLSVRGDDAVKRIARERLSGIGERLLRTKPLSACGNVLETVNDQKSLADLSINAQDAAVRAAAFAKMIGSEEPSQALLTTVAIQDARGDMGAKAVALIARRGLLKDVARKAKHGDVRAAALERAERVEAEADKPSAEQARRARLRALEALAPQLTRLAVTSDFDRGEEEWGRLESGWRNALALAPELPLEDTAQRLQDRLDRTRRDFNARRDAVRERVASDARAREDFLRELAARPRVSGEEAMRARQDAAVRWKALGLPPDDERAALESRLDSALAAHAPRPSIAPQDLGDAPSFPEAPVVVLTPEQIDELEKLSAESESLSQAPDFNEAMQRYQLLHKRWMMLTGDLPPSHPLKARFTAAYAAFKARRTAAREERQGAYAERVERLRELVAEAESLVPVSATVGEDPAAIRSLDARLRDVQARWKSVGPVRQGDAASLRSRFRAACDAAYVPVNANREAEDWERFAHLAKAQELTASVEALAESQDFGAIAESVKNAHRRWKALGPLPRDRQLEAWQRFKAACDAQFERCRPYFAELDAVRSENLAKKQALVAEAEALANAGSGFVGLAGSPADLAAKRAAADRFKSIQQEWKSIGPVPREHDRELWKRFRAVCDGFFESRKAEYSARSEEEQANLARKLELCAAAESLAVAAEAGVADAALAKPAEDTMRAVKDLQARWKLIGYVPRDQVEAVWARFRTACDRVYATLKEHLAAVEAGQQANLEKKREMIKELEHICAHENPHWFIDDVRDLQRQWRDIGYVPRDARDEVNARFKELTDRALSASRRN
ncbi:MAG: DUF349 domain-containing protein [Planctomycetes bacterium]|nr:DUF349 domain-containing protein [Planctomycetota bacterium]